MIHLRTKNAFPHIKPQRSSCIGICCAFVFLACCLFALAGCSSSESSRASNATNNASGAAQTTSIRIGTLATEDILPCWVAQEENLFASENLTATLVVFQSASELIAAVSSQSIDFAMTDPMVTASLYASGADVQIRWVTLGANASQGRFGIMSADSSITSLTDLAGQPIGVGSNTILEYVMDTLFERAGVPADQVIVEEIQKLPVRYQAMASGTVKAAALPASLLALGEACGYTVVADDTTGDNISQSVMISCSSAISSETCEAFARVWDAAVARINANPNSYRSLLASNASLPESIAQSYAVCTYPTAALPEQHMIDAVLMWMNNKGYLPAGISYDATTGCFQGRS